MINICLRGEGYGEPADFLEGWWDHCTGVPPLCDYPKPLDRNLQKAEKRFISLALRTTGLIPNTNEELLVFWRQFEKRLPFTLCCLFTMKHIVLPFQLRIADFWWIPKTVIVFALPSKLLCQRVLLSRCCLLFFPKCIIFEFVVVMDSLLTLWTVECKLDRWLNKSAVRCRLLVCETLDQLSLPSVPFDLLIGSYTW